MLARKTGSDCHRPFENQHGVGSLKIRQLSHCFAIVSNMDLLKFQNTGSASFLHRCFHWAMAFMIFFLVKANRNYCMVVRYCDFPTWYCVVMVIDCCKLYAVQWILLISPEKFSLPLNVMATSNFLTSMSKFLKWFLMISSLADA